MERSYGQYGEDRILELFFKDQNQGFLVDVGAADPMVNSNSYMLLQRLGWGGILIEPEPDQFKIVQSFYHRYAGVTCLNCAIGPKEGEAVLYQGGQISTLLPVIRQAGIDVHGDKIYTGETKVQVKNLTKILVENEVEAIDFLSIDCEGMDYEVWGTLDKSEYLPRLVCMEGTGYLMKGYFELCRVGGNTFYVRSNI